MGVMEQRQQQAEMRKSQSLERLEQGEKRLSSFGRDACRDATNGNTYPPSKTIGGEDPFRIDNNHNGTKKGKGHSKSLDLTGLPRERSIEEMMDNISPYKMREDEPGGNRKRDFAFS